jgi:NaMN:DMB phosphoribosyltransferase
VALKGLRLQGLKVARKRLTAAAGAAPAQVTPAVFRAIAAGKAASSVLCAAQGCDLHLVDVGVAADLSSVAAAAPHIQARRPEPAPAALPPLC